MDESHICNDHRHDGFISRCTKSTYDACTNERIITGSRCLPDVGQDTDETTDQDGGTTSEKVAEGNNDKVRVAERNGGRSKKLVPSAYYDK